MRNSVKVNVQTYLKYFEEFRRQMFLLERSVAGSLGRRCANGRRDLREDEDKVYVQPTCCEPGRVEVCQRGCPTSVGEGLERGHSD